MSLEPRTAHTAPGLCSGNYGLNILKQMIATVQPVVTQVSLCWLKNLHFSGTYSC